MSREMVVAAEELRQSALRHVRLGEVEEAIEQFDRALAEAADDEQRELIVINKADAMITLERTGPEVQALPAILMRRRNLHHTFLAAYALMYKFRLEPDLKRAIFYGEIALNAATEARETVWEIGANNELGIICEIDSQFPKAIAHFERALQLIGTVRDGDEHNFTYGVALQNLGASHMQAGDVALGIRQVHEALPWIVSPGAKAEAFIDLCYGYLEAGDLESARRFGESGLALGTDPRQVRNAHYLLGEVALKRGDEEDAERHFDELARFYPGFRNLKQLLYAVDLRGMINLKL